ncbi:MAG: NAD(P)/FAD-dependent oxidoreductase [Candidatus Limnocylindria bacterium]
MDVLLVGGGVASLRCARALRRNGFDGSILLVGDEDRAPYNRPPLSKEVLRDGASDDLLAAEPASWYAKRSVELWTDVRVTALDPDARRATFADGSLVSFERCLLATGAELRRLAIPGADQALMLRTARDAGSVREAAVAASQDAPVVVVGGGFIGLEVASALAGLGLRPTVVEVAPALWGGALGTGLAAWAAARLAESGIVLRLGSSVTRLTPGAAWVGDDRLAAGFVVAGIGVVPRDDLAAQAGIATGDGILVDAGQRTNHPAIWAAGDVTRVRGRRVEHWHAAREAGERAALSMLGLPVPAPKPACVFSEIAGTVLDVFGDATAWDEERWLVEGSVLACAVDGRVVHLMSIDRAVVPERARELIGSSMEEVQAAVTPRRQIGQ